MAVFKVMGDPWYTTTRGGAMAEPTVVLWDVDPVLRSACEAVALDWGSVVTSVPGELSSVAWAPGVRLAVVGRCSATSLRERLATARKLLPEALVVGLVTSGDLSVAPDLADLEPIAVADEGESAIGLASDLLEAGSVPPARWPAGLIGTSLAVALLRTRIATAASCDATVLLTGETGTGKSTVARAIHELSARSAAPFVHVDCAALSPTILESELFGHERGSFTGALARRPGRFEVAGEGSIFLDEIGEIADALQSKFLRVLEERLFERVGSSKSLTMRARVIAATQVDLAKAVAEERFRSDLYFRLHVYTVRIPSLRERRGDILALVAHALPRLCAQLGRPLPDVSRSFLQRLLEHTVAGERPRTSARARGCVDPACPRPARSLCLGGGARAASRCVRRLGQLSRDDGEGAPARGPRRDAGECRARGQDSRRP
jgi:hypothetical protein